MRSFIKWIGMAAGCLATVACMTMVGVPVNKRNPGQGIDTGDRVQVSKTNGQVLQFDVTKIDEKGIHGSGIHIPHRDIQSMEREQISWWRTGLIGLGIAAAAALIASASSGGGGGSSGGGGGW